MKTVAVLHTVPATVPMMKSMIRERYGEVNVVDWMDDSILPMLAEDPEKIPYVLEKLLTYAKFAERQGADLVLDACSSVGEIKDYAEGKLGIPLLRIDDPVTDYLAAHFKKIAVLATQPTTLRPSAALMMRKGPELEIVSRLVEGAAAAAAAGDQDRHDRLIADAVLEVMETGDAVFLAQASMAAAMRLVPEELQARVFTSPGFMIEELGKYLP